MVKSFFKPLIEIAFFMMFVATVIIYVSRINVPTSKSEVLGIKNISHGVRVSATVGEFRFRLFGYTSPGALISLEGMNLSDKTYAGNDGYFEFKNGFSPLSPRETCLIATDQFGRTSSPLCLPPFPTRYDAVIGPIILPPTISLSLPSSGKDYYIGDDTILTGQTIPNSLVSLSMFTNDKNRPILAFVKPVEAFSFPELSTMSDDRGNFSISLPSSSSQTYHFFTTVNYQQESSPKSLTLTFKVKPLWMIILDLFMSLWHLMTPYTISLLVLAQILLIFIYFYRSRLHPHHISRMRALSLRTESALMKRG